MTPRDQIADCHISSFIYQKSTIKFEIGQIPDKLNVFSLTLKRNKLIKTAMTAWTPVGPLNLNEMSVMWITTAASGNGENAIRRLGQTCLAGAGFI